MRLDVFKKWSYSVALLLLTFTFIIPAGAEAKTLYVNAATGNDATTYAGNGASTPWRSIGRAAWGSTSYAAPNASQAAQAGDTVLIAEGIYWESGDPNGNRWSVALNPANTGIAGNPIIFRGVGLVYIRLNSGIRGPMIGCASSRNYIIWDHFQIDDYYGGSQSDTGPVVFNGSHHCQLINSDVQGHSGSYYHGYSTWSDNYNAVRYEFADFTVIRNNRIHRVWGTNTTSGRGGQNDAGIMTYDSNDGLIENNEIYDTGQGIIIKGTHAGSTQARNTIRYNYVHDNVMGGIRALGAQDTHVYQNIIARTSIGQGLWAGFFDSARSRFVNNTVYGNANGAITQGTNLIDVQFHNNLIINNSTCGACNYDVASPALQQVSFTRNLYFNNANTFFWNMDGTRNIIPFSTWQSTYRFDVDGLNGINPLLVDPANGNFRLQANSPALTLGRDVLDLNNNGNTTDVIPAGAYITGAETIGLLSGSVGAALDTTPPMPPVNLRVN